MISHKHKIVFVHPNKCGGNSVEAFFEGESHKRIHKRHMRLKGYKNKYPEEFENYFKFAFTRNPFDRLVSVFHGRVQGKMVPRNKTLAELGFTESIKSGHIFKFCKTQVGHYFNLRNKDGTIPLDFIGRVENYQKDFNIVCDKIGIPHQQLPHKNASKHKHYTEYYNDETKQIVAEKYAKDIEYFNYEFGE